MYHFTITDHAAETTVLNEHTELSGRAVKFLKDFQISAVRFLFEQFCARDFSILNDESGLGKTASVAVFLGIVSARKNCLIVVSNNDECVTSWRFHLDILTDLKVSVLSEEKDYNAMTYNVYIVKWNVLRSIGDLSKLNFDLIIADNREQILSNSFCISTLLKNFEKKVQLVISSVDVTSDVKLMHNILRLGGRLEHQLESFKAFELKFKLPDLKAISSKKSDLEDYFLRREILNDYCRDFRLRRYRHQFEDALPLVDPGRYKTFVNEWQRSLRKGALNGPLLVGEPLPYEMDTEELLEQYQTNPQSIYVDSAITQATTPTKNITFHETQNTMTTPTPTALDITDDLMDMPPLLFVADSEDDADDEDEDVIFLSSESAEAAAAAIPVIEIEEEEVEKTPQKSSTTKVKVEKLSPKKKPEAMKTNSAQEAMENNSAQVTAVKTRQKNKRKSTTPKQLKSVEKTENASPKEHQLSTPRTRSSKKNDAVRTRGSMGKRSDVKRTEANVEKIKTLKIKRKEQKKSTERPAAPQPKKTISADALQAIKAEKSTPKKNDQIKKTKSAQNVALKIESEKEIVKKSKGTKTSTGLKIESSKELVKGSKTPVQKSPTDVRRSRKRISGPLICAPLRDTRNMQRSTRSSGGKRKCFSLDFDDDNKKTKTKAKPKQQTVVSTKKIEKVNKAQNTSKTETLQGKAKSTESPKDKNRVNTKPKSPTQPPIRETPQILLPPSASKKAKATKTKALVPPQSVAPGSTQSSVLPSSEYEEIQCGQKLIYSSSNDNTPPMMIKPNEFLVPSTPPSFRAMQFSTQQLVANDSDSDVMLLLPSSSSQKRKVTDSVVVLSSSQDDASLSSQASSAEQCRPVTSKMSTSIGTQKRKRYSKRTSLPVTTATVTATAAVTKEPLTFGVLLAKQRKNAKSPDLFSVASDVAVSTQGSSTVISATQPTPLATTTSPIFGFKIFGSEVRSFQQTTANIANTTDNAQLTTRPKRVARSCLNILEQMFENNETTTSIQRAKSSTDNTKSKELRKLRNASRTNTQPTAVASAARKRKLVNVEASSQLSQQPTARKPIHERQQKPLGESDDVFEITNNATFGSTLRISAGGHISPVTAAVAAAINHNNGSHNKITNYLIGNSGVTEQLLATPNKRLPQQQQQQQPSSSLPGSANSGVAVTIATTQTRKSPKSAKSTQTTKLTKWFRRSSVDDSCPNKNANKSRDDVNDKSSKSAKLVKRRRLDLTS